MDSDKDHESALALWLEGAEIAPETLRAAINAALVEQNIAIWPSIEAEVFTYGSKTLVIARPRLPKLLRGTGSRLRLRRS